MILDQCDPQNIENLLKNVDCHLKLIQFFIYLSNYQEKHRSYSLFSSAEDKTQV